MPAKDLYHEAVKQALINDGWTITHDPYPLEAWDSATYEIDFGAEKVLAAEKGSQKIAVEVKSFLSASMAYEFHGVLGQYLNYQSFIEVKEPDRILFLAITKEVYEKFFTKKSTIYITDKFHVKIPIFNPKQLNIEQWIIEK